MKKLPRWNICKILVFLFLWKPIQKIAACLFWASAWVWEQFQKMENRKKRSRLHFFILGFWGSKKAFGTSASINCALHDHQHFLLQEVTQFIQFSDPEMVSWAPSAWSQWILQLLGRVHLFCSIMVHCNLLKLVIQMNDSEINTFKHNIPLKII